jgi:1-aminocyclopropane-1-carboxylate deaminase/D-cysteine desulfhydrase-like pyridoxal-dependent ACC family enzyme
LLGLSTRIVGIAADGPSASIHAQVRANIGGIAELLKMDPDSVRRGTPIEIDDQFIGEGYGIPTTGSQEAIDLAARTEAIFLDPTYTGKAMAGLISYVRQQRFTEGQTIVFWHTGGQVGLFA